MHPPDKVASHQLCPGLVGLVTIVHILQERSHKSSMLRLAATLWNDGDITTDTQQRRGGQLAVC